jgi:hypothetical protein
MKAIWIVVVCSLTVVGCSKMDSKKSSQATQKKIQKIDEKLEELTLDGPVKPEDRSNESEGPVELGTPPESSKQSCSEEDKTKILASSKELEAIVIRMESSVDQAESAANGGNPSETKESLKNAVVEADGGLELCKVNKSRYSVDVDMANCKIEGVKSAVQAFEQTCAKLETSRAKVASTASSIR